MPCEVFITDANRTSCRFNHSESDLIAYSDGLACKFHLPLIDNNGNETVKAKWGQEELQAFNDDILPEVTIFEHAKGTKDFSGVVFPGAINLSRHRLDSNFDQAVFHGKADFGTTAFDNKSSFKGTIFDAEVNFQKATFRNAISFCSAKFNGPCNFTGAKFKQDSYFNSAVFTKEINLSEATFQQDASFIGVSFKGETLFNNIRFEKKLSFDSVEFSQKLSFDNVHFRDDVTFQNAQFHSKSYFGFQHNLGRVERNSGQMSFSGALFHSEADFSGREFRNHINFVCAQFKRDVTFKDSLFHRGVDFQGAIFHKRAEFTDTRFLTHMKFVNTQFLLGASFDRVTFDRVTDGEHSYSFPFTDFSKSIFKESVSFINRTFLTTTSFEDCVFHVAPKFQGCKLHQDTIFPPERNFKDHSKSAAPSYRTLKLDMENRRARQEEAMFNALEEKCRVADPETPFMVKCFSRLYEYASDYEQSLGRSIFGMGIISLIFFGLYWYLSIFSITELSGKSLVPVIGFTIEQSVIPFKVWGLSDSDSLGWLRSSVDLVKLKIIATVHSLFFLAFSGLFISALRWRFKKG